MFWERFTQLCESVDAKPNAVIKQITGSDKSGSVSAWKKGVLPATSMLVDIADYFNCSIDYLIGRSDTPHRNEILEATGLTDDETDLIEFFRGMSRFDRREILVTAKRMYDAEKGAGTQSIV